MSYIAVTDKTRNTVPCRAYDATFGVWLGPVESYDAARERGERHGDGQVQQSGARSAVWVTRQEGRIAVHADTDASTAARWREGDPVYPPGGCSAGAVRWRV